MCPRSGARPPVLEGLVFDSTNSIPARPVKEKRRPVAIMPADPNHFFNPVLVEAKVIMAAEASINAKNTLTGVSAR